MRDDITFRRIHFSNYSGRRRRKFLDPIIPYEALLSVLENQCHMCAICGISIVHDFELDHIFPISRGGQHQIRNIQFLCRSCNRAKFYYTDFPTRLPMKKPRQLELYDEPDIAPS